MKFLFRSIIVISIPLVLSAISCEEKSTGTKSSANINTKNPKTVLARSSNGNKSINPTDRELERKRLILSNTLNSYELISERLLDQTAALNNKDLTEISQFFENGPIEDCKKLLAEIPIDDSYNNFLTRFSTRFASDDIVGAINWLKDIKEEANLQSAYSVIGNKAADNPQIAESFIKTISDSGLRFQFATSYVRGLIDNPNEFNRVNEIMSSESKRSDLGLDVQGVVMALGSARSEEISDLSLNYMKTLLENYNGPLSQLSKVSISDMVDPYHAQVADFIKKNSESKNVAEVFTGPLVQSWARKDPNAASSWLETQKGKSRDLGIVGLVSTIAKLQPQSAMQWAISASDPAIRMQAVGTVASQSFSEMEAKKTVILESNLPPGEKEKFMKMITH